MRKRHKKNIEEISEAIIEETVEESKSEEVAEVTVEEAKPEEVAEVTVEEAKSEEVAEATVEEAKPEEVAAATVEEAKPEEVAEATTEETTNSKKGNKKAINIFQLVLPLAVIISFLLIVICNSGSKGIEGEAYRVSDKGVGYTKGLLYNQKAETIPWEVDGRYTVNFDESAMVYVVKDDEYADEEYVMYYIDHKLEPEKLDSFKFGDGIIWTNIGDSGQYIITVVDNGNKTKDNADIYIYNVSKGKNTVVARDVIPQSVVSSPNCKTVAYVSNYESEDDNSLYVAGVNMEPEKIAKDGCYPKTVTDNGKGVIYLDTLGNKLFCYDGKESEKISSKVDQGIIYTNCSEDEVIYRKAGKTYCFKIGDEEAEKIVSSEVYYFLCKQYMRSDINVDRLSISTFANSVFLNKDYKLCMINDKKDDVIKINSNSNDCVISSDKKSMLFAEGEELYYIKDLSKNPEAEMIFTSEEIEKIITNSDFSKIYIVNEEDELIYVTKSGKHKTISDDIDRTIAPVICEDSGKIYYIEDDNLYEAETSKKSRTMIKSDVVELKSALTGVYYINDEEKVGLIF